MLLQTDVFVSLLLLVHFTAFPYRFRVVRVSVIVDTLAVEHLRECFFFLFFGKDGHLRATTELASVFGLFPLVIDGIVQLGWLLLAVVMDCSWFFFSAGRLHHLIGFTLLAEIVI